MTYAIVLLYYSVVVIIFILIVVLFIASILNLLTKIMLYNIIDTAFLDGTIGTKQSSWTAEISLTNHPIQHTGVEVTAIFDKVFSSLYNAKLQKVSKVLLGLVQQKLAVTSQFDDHFLHKGEAYQHPVFVVKGLKNNPLGLPNVIALNLVI